MAEGSAHAGMTGEKYGQDPLLFYPGRSLSEADRERIDSYRVDLDELTADKIIYSMSRQIEANFQTFFTTAEAVVGRAAALEIAREVGRRYGGRGYATFLASRGYVDTGSPRAMAMYQDLVHAIRGPKHASALFAEYDDTRCVVRRSRCIYYSEAQPENGDYTREFEAGCFEGYVAADRNLLRVEVKHCRFQGADGCEQHWVFKEPKDRHGSGE